MSSIEKISEKIASFVGGLKMPLDVLPPRLLKCMALQRRGPSAMETFCHFVNDCEAAGIPMGIRENGEPNDLATYSYLLINNIFRNLGENMVVHVEVCKEDLPVVVTGENAGGKFIAYGTPLYDVTLNGIAKLNYTPPT